MNSSEKVRLPKNFFSKERKIISLKESLKDVIPVEWVKCNNGKEIKNDEERNIRKEK